MSLSNSHNAPGDYRTCFQLRSSYDLGLRNWPFFLENLKVTFESIGHQVLTYQFDGSPFPDTRVVCTPPPLGRLSQPRYCYQQICANASTSSSWRQSNASLQAFETPCPTLEICIRWCNLLQEQEGFGTSSVWGALSLCGTCLPSNSRICEKNNSLARLQNSDCWAACFMLITHKLSLNNVWSSVNELELKSVVWVLQIYI